MIISKRIVSLVSALLILLIFLISFFFYGYYRVKTPLAAEGADLEFKVVKGEGVFEIAKNLEKQGLISNDFWFITYVWTKGWASKLQADTYLFSKQMTIAEMARQMVVSKLDYAQDIQVTIPEGFNLRQIDARLAEKNLISQGQLIAFNQTASSSDLLLKYPQLFGQLKNSQLSLEGYLFPDTYRFRPQSSIEEIVLKMLANFDKKIDQQLRQETTAQAKTLKEIIIMASLIEKEVRTDQDRAIVSGIFWQRLKDKYPLQSCATIAYALGLDKWRYSVGDTKVDSPYNTYRNIGLPLGPITNPGLSAIEAAIYPQKTDYYFFLSEPTNGQTIFSKNLEEHNQNIRKYLN